MVKDPYPSPNIFPNKISNPTAHALETNTAVDTMLDARETLMEANGYSVDRVTGEITIT
jgi:hypothetical protein